MLWLREIWRSQSVHIRALWLVLSDLSLTILCLMNTLWLVSLPFGFKLACNKAIEMERYSLEHVHFHPTHMKIFLESQPTYKWSYNLWFPTINASLKHLRCVDSIRSLNIWLVFLDYLLVNNHIHLLAAPPPLFFLCIIGYCVLLAQSEAGCKN